MATAGELRGRIRQAVERLRGIGSDNPRLEAEHLAAHACAGDRRDLLLLRDEDSLAEDVLDRFERLIERRLRREPLQYILGTVPFCDLELEVGPGVLIPRPETEVLVSRVKYWLDRLEIGKAAGSRTAVGEQMASHGDRVTQGADATATWVIDVGTGTGAILLALLAQLPGWRGLGIDRSLSALGYAIRNRSRNRADRSYFACGDLLAPIRRAKGGRLLGGRISAVVSNPPYVPTGELASLAPEVVDHEPRIALDGGVDGLVVVREILDQSRRLIEPGGMIAFELALGQSGRVAELLEGGGFDLLEVFHDLTGRDRGVIAQRKWPRRRRADLRITGSLSAGSLSCSAS